jgi:hypothetical protein
MIPMSRPINMFIIYAREDKEIKLRLLAFLNPFVKPFNLNIWHDGNIEAGQEWQPHIQSRLNQTDIFIMLVSIDFMNSEFINEVEFKHAIQRHKENKSVVVPVIINYCPWRINPDLSSLQVLPDEGKPIDDWKTPSQAFNNIADGLEKVLISITNNRSKQEVQEDVKASSPSSPSEQQSKQKDNEEETAWHIADEEKTIDSYYNYLNKYPNGKYKTAALRATKILENLNARKQRNEREEALWKTACDSNSISFYKEYLDKTELSLYKEQAHELLEKLEKENSEKDEETYWAKARKENSINAYENYLQKYSEGKYAKEATTAIANLEAEMEEDFLWKTTLKENTYASYKSYLRETKLGKNREEAQSFIKKIEELQRNETEENTFWNHAQQVGSINAYQEYLSKYPNGKKAEQALSVLKKLQEVQYEVSAQQHDNQNNLKYLPKEYKSNFSLYLIASILIIMWLFGFFVYSAAGLIHLFIIVAIVLVAVAIARRST